jgi:hypothetical protein
MLDKTVPPGNTYLSSSLRFASSFVLHHAADLFQPFPSHAPYSVTKITFDPPSSPPLHPTSSLGTAGWMDKKNHSSSSYPVR